MNVNNRKLFANRDARRRLADMGGIVASSPELMDVARGLPHRLVDRRIENMIADRYDENVNRRERRADELYEAARGEDREYGSGFLGRLLESLAERDDRQNRRIANTFADPQGRNKIDREIADFMRSHSQTVSGFAPGGMVTPYERSIERMYEMESDELQAAGLPRFAGSAMGYLGRNRAMDMLQNIDPNIGREEFERMSPQERRDAGFAGSGLINRQYFDIRDELMESQFPMQGPEMPPEGPTRLAAEEYINPVDEFGGAGMPSMPTLPTPAAPAEEPREPEVLTPGSPEEVGGDPSTMETFPEDEEVVRRTPEQPVILSPAEAAAAEAGGTGSTAEDRVLTAEELAEVVNTSDDPSGAMADQILGTGGPDAPSSVEERISQYEALFGRMFGQDDEEKNRERWMNMAMIGFAIAAGEDPSALKNIADGLLQGAQVSREDMATRRQRRDRIQELAVAAGLEDERLAQRLAGESRFSPTEPFVDAVRTLAQSSLDQGLYPDIGTALRASEEALAPYYGLTPGTAAAEIQTVATQEEYDALEPGTEFIQMVDGEAVRRIKPAE